jgi:hypothetical protein
MAMKKIILIGADCTVSFPFTSVTMAITSPRWDQIQVDFGNDETGNFGPREETGSALYQVNTVCTISPGGEVSFSWLPIGIAD